MIGLNVLMFQKFQSSNQNIGTNETIETLEQKKAAPISRNGF